MKFTYGTFKSHLNRSMIKTYHKIVDSGNAIGLKNRIHIHGFELERFSGSQQHTADQYKTSRRPGVRMAPMVAQPHSGFSV